MDQTVYGKVIEVYKMLVYIWHMYLYLILLIYN
jgi:hypothetical protein